VTELDAEIHQPTRLRILMLLSGVRSADFSFLLNTLGLTNGNLSAHMTRLEELGYVEVTKKFVGKVPNTEYSLTPRGRERLKAYWQAMDALRATGGRV
jgi:DNA-binding MarR family transcriptional regulator